MKFSGVTILQGVEFSIFPIDFEWALQQCSATALPVMRQICLFSKKLNHRKGTAQRITSVEILSTAAHVRKIQQAFTKCNFCLAVQQQFNNTYILILVPITLLLVFVVLGFSFFCTEPRDWLERTFPK